MEFTIGTAQEPYHKHGHPLPDWVFRGILAGTLAIASAALGWSFSISKDVAMMQQGQQDSSAQLQEINRRLEDIQLRLMQKDSTSNGVYYPPPVRLPNLGQPAAAHPIKTEGGFYP